MPKQKIEVEDGDDAMTDKQAKIRVRKTPNCLHAYTATMKGKGTYGWGNTPDKARECLMRNLTNESR